MQLYKNVYTGEVKKFLMPQVHPWTRYYGSEPRNSFASSDDTFQSSSLDFSPASVFDVTPDFSTDFTGGGGDFGGGGASGDW